MTVNDELEQLRERNHRLLYLVAILHIALREVAPGHPDLQHSEATATQAFTRALAEGKL